MRKTGTCAILAVFEQEKFSDGYANVTQASPSPYIHTYGHDEDIIKGCDYNRMTAHYDGLREDKITILIPRAMNDDLRALRLVTGQSTGDLINELLDAHLSSCPEDIGAGRDMLEVRARRAAQREGRRAAEAVEAAELPPEGEGTQELPDDAFIESWLWSEKEVNRNKCRMNGAAYRDWCRSEGRPFESSVWAYTSEVLEKKLSDKTHKPFTPDTVRTYRQMIERLVEAWRIRRGQRHL